MPTITDEQYEEYQRLSLTARKSLELDSIKGVNLEQDIDAPIKKCVMAFALLQCWPLWSCCGFDYYGQPVHKWHEYGRVFFILTQNEFTYTILSAFANIGKNEWVIRRLNQDRVDFHANFYNPIPEWEHRECPYYYEPATAYIADLERFLLYMKDSMLPEIVLTDSSAKYKEMYPAWQYPPRGDWLIRKEDL